LHTFGVICNTPFSGTEKSILRKYLDERSAETGGDKALALGWDLEVNELKALKAKLIVKN
jgi:hypothetical protein